MTRTGEFVPDWVALMDDCAANPKAYVEAHGMGKPGMGTAETMECFAVLIAQQACEIGYCEGYAAALAKEVAV